MSDDSNKWLNLSSALGEESKKTRRNLLIVSIVCLLIGYTGQLPTQIAILGIELHKANSNILGIGVFWGTVYLWVHFLICGTLDFLPWIKDFHLSRARHNLLKNKYNHLLGNPEYRNEDDVYPYGLDKDDITKNGEVPLLNALNEEVENHVSDFWYKFRLLVRVRVFLDVGLPLILGLFGLYKLFFVIDFGIHGCF